MARPGPELDTPPVQVTLVTKWINLFSVSGGTWWKHRRKELRGTRSEGVGVPDCSQLVEYFDVMEWLRKCWESKASNWVKRVNEVIQWVQQAKLIKGLIETS